VRPSIERFDIILRVRQSVQRDEIPQATAESRALLARLVGVRA
jgi:hypothetical protein